MTDTVRWGILSTANIGRKRVIPAMKHMRHGRVVAVASRDLDRARAFAADLDIPTAYGSYEELLADPDIDAVYNPLPNSLHAEWAIKCAEAGKPMLCEKPLASDAAEAQTMVDAFAARDLAFAEAFMYRFHPQTQRVKTMVDDGAVGEVQVIRATFSFFIDDARAGIDIRLNKALAGGSLMDVGCYCVNVIRLLTGEEPEDAQAFARWWPSGVDETLAGILRFPSGVVAHFDSSLRAQLNDSYEIRGTEGRIRVESAFVVGPDESPVIRYWCGDHYEAITIPATNQYTLMAEDFNEALLNDRPPRFPPQDAVRNIAVIDRLLASAQAGR